MHALRIISGIFKSRRLLSFSIPILKPTGIRIRSTLFNWLQEHIFFSTCLDVFAGSGILGIESISRGSRYCKFIDINKCLVDLLKRNVSKLDLYGCFEILHQDAISYLKKCNMYDIIFLDPPFYSNLLELALFNIYNNSNINSNTLIYIETSKFLKFTSIKASRFKLIRSKIYGNVFFALLHKI